MTSTKFQLNDEGDLFARIDDQTVTLMREDGSVLCRLHPQEMSRLVDIWSLSRDISDDALRFKA